MMSYLCWLSATEFKLFVTINIHTYCQRLFHSNRTRSPQRIPEDQGGDHRVLSQATGERSSDAEGMHRLSCRRWKDVISAKSTLTSQEFFSLISTTDYNTVIAIWCVPCATSSLIIVVIIVVIVELVLHRSEPCCNKCCPKLCKWRVSSSPGDFWDWVESMWLSYK